MGQLLPDAYDPATIPQVEKLDELETFVGTKKWDVPVPACIHTIIQQRQINLLSQYASSKLPTLLGGFSGYTVLSRI